MWSLLGRGKKRLGFEGIEGGGVGSIQVLKVFVCGKAGASGGYEMQMCKCREGFAYSPSDRIWGQGITPALATTSLVGQPPYAEYNTKYLYTSPRADNYLC